MAPAKELPPNLSESSPPPAPDSDTVPAIEHPASKIDNNKTSPGKKRGRKKGKGKYQNDKAKDKSSIAAEGGKEKAQPKQTYILEGSDKFPDIIIEKQEAAAEYTKKVRSSCSHWVMYTDASSPGSSPAASPEPSSPLRGRSASVSSSETASSSSRGSSPSEPESPPSLIQYSGAAVVYEDKSAPTGWYERGFGLQGVVRSGEAEMYGVDQALQLALDALSPEDPRKKVSLLTDSQEALRMIKKQLTSKTAKFSKVTEAAASKTVKLRERGIQLELRWVPGHTKLPGNMVADRCAADTRVAFENNKASSIGKITPWSRPKSTVRERLRRESGDSSSTLSSTGDSSSQEPD
ncbi:hypothetical protein ASPCAL04037 [Aspergillus calidoustus]|uniref:RNase H type-1 domain-containing protein n=1 Tax=Aspergillus calidoustus TaxID=454130 RepID=A0A0U5C4I8_ASPCI|nr:hypothetical protein ASPCAL04037 [Aspergillus calidoustus]